MKNNDHLITLQQVAAVTGLSKIGVLKLMLMGELKPIKQENKQYFYLSTVLKWKYTHNQNK